MIKKYSYGADWFQKGGCTTVLEYRHQLHIFTYIQAGQWGFIEYRPPNKKPEYRPNIDHTALYRPNIDRKISLKNEYYRN